MVVAIAFKVDVAVSRICQHPSGRNICRHFSQATVCVSIVVGVLNVVVFIETPPHEHALK